MIPILATGVLNCKSLMELESDLVADYGDIFSSQIAVPEGEIFSEDKAVLKEKLKDSSGNSAEASRLQNIQSKEAEITVQEAILKSASSKKCPVIVLRGVQTYKDVGKHLENYGIKVSRLNQLMKGEEGRNANHAVEHDIVVLAMNGNRLIISFIQVNIPCHFCESYICYLCRSRQIWKKSK